MRKVFEFISGLFKSQKKTIIPYKVNGRNKSYSIQILNHETINFEPSDPQARLMIYRDKLGASLSKEFPNRKIQIDRIESSVKLMNGLALIRGDLNKANEYIGLTSSTEKTVQTEGLLAAAMVTYMKAFTSTNGRVQLHPGIIPKELLISHQEIKELRDKYLFHADLKAKFEIPTNLIIFDEGQFIVEEPMLHKLRIFDVRDLLPPLIDFLLEHINNLILENRKKAEVEMNGLLRKKH